jgi:tetratricopeptide (TPR) repeat protein
MPRTEDIERFAQVLNALGDEPAIRAARSETIETVAAPGAEDEDGAEPGAGLDTLPGGAPEAESGTAEQADLQDLFDGLSALPGDEDQGSTPGPGDAGAEAPGGEDGIDFSSLLGEETGPQSIEDLETGPGAGQVPGSGADAAAAPSDEDFSFPGVDPGDFQSDLSSMEVVPDAAAGTEAEEPTPGSFGDLDAFAAGPSDTAADQEAEPSAESGPEGLDLPSLDDLSFAEPSSGEPQSDPFADPGAGERDAAGTTDEAPAEPAFTDDTAVTDEAAGGFDLDGMSLEGIEGGPAESGALPEMGAEGFGPDDLGAGPAAEETEEQGAAQTTDEPGVESLGEEALGDLDEFALPESAEAFGVPPAPKPAPRAAAKPAARTPAPRPKPAAAAPRPRPAAAAVESEEPAGDIELSPEEFARLKTTLEALPRNLKIAVQDLIGAGTAQGADLRKLIRLLVDGASAQEIATLASRISGKRIRVPAGYEKKTGAALEAEQATFAYAFRQNILPLVRVVALTLVAGALLGFLGYRFVYRPLSALSNYRAGYAQIQRDNYAVANERFNAAVNVWPVKNWFMRYARAFADKRQYVLAEEKYEQLLARYGYDKPAYLAYADMETNGLGDYARADSLLKKILDRVMYDYDALLASGDNFIAWAEGTPSKLESARLAYATLLDRYGVRDDLLFRMLRYFIRADNGPEVERLRAYYDTKPEVKIDPVVWAELGGYLVDHRRMDFVQRVLFRADKANPTIPEVHYALARYYRIVGMPEDEKKALDQVVRLLKLRVADPITRKRLALEIDTHTRLGEYWYRQQQYISATTELQQAITLIERSQRMKLIAPDRMFGRPYAQLGDLYYYVQGDLPAAETEYRAAVSNRYTNPGLTYRIGYVEYARADYKAALTTFSAAEDALPTYVPDDSDTAVLNGQDTPGAAALLAAARQPPENLLYALGTTFYQRGDYFAAQGTYLRLLQRLETRRTAIGTLQPDQKPSDKALLVMIERVNNNLGMTLLRLAERTGDRSKRSEGLVYLTASTQIADSLARNLASVDRSLNLSMAAQNMRALLYPTRGAMPGIDPKLPRDFAVTEW